MATTVDGYLAGLPEARRAALSRLRTQIRAAAPEAEEKISYQVPTYVLHGPLVHFAAQAKHLSFTIVSLAAVQEFRRELAAFSVSGRTAHFSPEAPIPAALVKRIVGFRVQENKARASA